MASPAHAVLVLVPVRVRVPARVQVQVLDLASMHRTVHTMMCDTRCPWDLSLAEVPLGCAQACWHHCAASLAMVVAPQRCSLWWR